MSARPAVLITGAAKRVGASIARHFASGVLGGGYDIALHYNESETEAQALSKDIKAQGVACELFRQDLTDIAAIPALMQKVHKAMPHCAVLVNNASVFERATLMETDEALFERQFITNFKAPFFLTQSFAKTFSKGCVINILDTDIAQTGGSHFAYLLSKKALADFTLMASRSLGPHIRVNGICPGYVLPHSAEDAANIRKVESALPLKEHGTPEETSEAVLWVCGQKHITGQIIYIDGGKHAL